MCDRRCDDARAGAGERRRSRLGADCRRPGGAASAPLISDAGPDDVDALRELFHEYAAAIGESFWRNRFEEELAALPGWYDALLIARFGDELAGSVAIKRLPDGTAELKRLYVRPPWRGTGLGRMLARAAIERACELGYAVLRLDTLPEMDEARALYASLGFVPTEPFNDNPIPGVLFFELLLRP